MGHCTIAAQCMCLWTSGSMHLMELTSELLKGARQHCTLMTACDNTSSEVAATKGISRGICVSRIVPQFFRYQLLYVIVNKYSTYLVIEITQQMPWVVMVTMVFQWTARSMSTGKRLLHQWHFSPGHHTVTFPHRLGSMSESKKLRSAFLFFSCKACSYTTDWFAGWYFLRSSISILALGLFNLPAWYSMRWKFWVYPFFLVNPFGDLSGYR